MLSVSVLAGTVEAQPHHRLCDPAETDCRDILIRHIRAEDIGLDVAFWFMEDARFSSALARAQARGVRVRVLMDSRANVDYPGNVFCLDQLRGAGIPMREKFSPGILHWKMMLFVGQNTVQFSGANYSAEAFVPYEPYKAYVDEVIYFTDRPSYVDSFKTMFDRVWITEEGYRNYANVTTPQAAYGVTAIDPELSFGPFESFRNRSLAAYSAETLGIDALMFRITDRAHTDRLIQVVQAGVRVRLVTEQLQYRDTRRLWHAWNVDRLWAAGQQRLIGGAPGIQVRLRQHDGLSHEKLTILHGQSMSILGSSNWTSPSSDTQLEHNLFTTNPAVYTWSRDHFERKWFNRAPAAETRPFTPLPPDIPQIASPAPGANNLGLPVTLSWRAGAWAHRYDVYVGTDPNSMTKVVDDREFGPYDQSHTVTNLLPATVYYWRVVSRTMAGLERSTPICSFKTAGGGAGLPMSSCLAAPAGAPDPIEVLAPQDRNVPPPTDDGHLNPGTPLIPTPVGQIPSRTPSAHGTGTGRTAVPRRTETFTGD